MKKIHFCIVAFFLFSPHFMIGQTYTINSGGSVGLCSGNLYDSGGPSGNYSNNENYVMEFCSNNSMCVVATFNSFNLENGQDFLYVYDGPSTSSPLLATLTGTTLPPAFTASYGCLTFQFISNDTIKSSGFDISFSCVSCANPGGGNGTLTLVYNKSACGLNYVQSSQKVTTRYPTPPGSGLPVTLNIAGLPAPNTCSSIENAYLWWTESSISNAPVTMSIVNPAGNTFNYNVSTIGQGADKCWVSWGAIDTKNYRIDVTGAISGNGNYVINISSGDGAVDGITLLITYRDMLATYKGNLILSDGLIVSTDGSGSSVSLTGFNACSNSTFATAFIMVGDNQDNVYPPTHTTTLNGANTVFPNNFWNFDDQPTTVTAGQTSALFGTAPDSYSDCYSFVGAGLYYQTTTCGVCPSSAFAVPVTQSGMSCNGGTATANPGGGSFPYTYSWSSGGTTQTVTGLSPASYTVTVTDANGCSATGTITITSPPPVSDSISSINASCIGSSDGQATVFGSGGTAPYSYIWSTSSTIPTISGLPPGSYSVVITDAANCSHIDTVTITGLIIIAPTAGANTTYCQGDSITALTAVPAGNGTISWYSDPGLNTLVGTGANFTPSNSSPGTYTYYAAETSGICKGPGTGVTITINNPATVNAGVNSSVCANSVYILSGSIGGAASSSTWTTSGTGTFNNNALPNAIYNPSPTDILNGFVYLTLTTNNPNGVCNAVSDTMKLSFNFPAVADTTNVTTSPANCGGSTGAVVGLSITSGQSPYSYQWKDSLGNNVGIGTINLSNVNSGQYTLTITDANGCSTLVGPYTVVSTPDVIAGFTANPITGETPLSVSFTNGSVNATNYLWHFGTGDSVTTVSPVYIYLPTGTFIACLLAIDSTSGCTDTACSTIDVFINSVFIIPNIFTPNHDGVNDVFSVVGKGLKTLDAEIYDRWGLRIYEWHTTNGGWDGYMTSGVMASDGTYYYILNATGTDEKKYFQKGAFTLVH